MEIREILRRADRGRVDTPLIDAITNNVTVNDVAQTILSYGGKPMMIDDLREIKEGVAISDGLYINIGTMGYEKGDSMILGANVARENNIPVILDPVGVHVTKLRRKTVEDILIPKSLRLYGSSDSMSLSIFGMVKGMVMPLLVFPSIFLASFSTLIIPEIAEANALNKKNTVNYIISKVIKFTLLIAIFSTGIFIVFSQELAVGLYKSEDVGYLLRILAPLIPFMYLDKIVDGSLNALDLQITTLKYNIIDMFVRITSITLLIPRYGIKGFVLVLFISTTFNTSLGVIKILKETKLKYDILDWILKPTISITLSSYATKIILYCLHINNAVFISIILDLLIYFAMLILFKAITKKDIQWFANGFKKDIKKGKWETIGIYKQI